MPGAVFLSYASQDAEAAKRICEALRAAGVEVWFDQSELRGGDAWDAKIRRQIKECALFVPIISPNTNARAEGYFRREWKQAVERTHDMADDVPFLFPIILGDVTDSAARVPDKFREVQWTRLRLDETPAELGTRVARLLSKEPEEGRVERSTGNRPGRREKRPAWLRYAWSILALVIVGYYGLRPLWRPARPPATNAPAVVAAEPSEIARVRARIIPDRWQKGDFDAIAPALDRLIAANPDEADAWALRSIIHSLQVVRLLDPGTKALEAGKTAAERALRLAPESPLGHLALGMHLVANVSRGGDPRACRESIDRAVAALPPDGLTRYAELVSFWLGYDFENTEHRAQAWLEAEPQASYPAWIMTSLSVTTRQAAEVEKWAERSFRDHDLTSVRALCNLTDAQYFLRADLAAARAALERVPMRARSIPRVVYWRWLLAMSEQRWDDALQELAQVPDPLLFDVVYNGPKTLLAGLAHQRAGRAEAAAAQFREAERLLREALGTDPDNEALRAVLAVTLASAGRATEARDELALVEPLVRVRAPNVYRPRLVMSLAQAYGALGDFKNMAFWLRKLFAEPSSAPLTPASFRLDPRFNRAAGAPEIQALLKEFASLDQPAATPAAKADNQSVAVLAFANLSDDKGNEYFSDGISEELLNVLAKVPGLKVTARTSSFHFKGTNTPIPEIAKQLGVAYVVEGSVRKAGDKVRITAQLIKAADGFHVWSETFTRDLKDIFAVQDEIAGLIAQNLSLKLGARSPRAAVAVSPQAFELYVQARQAWSLRTTEGFARAEQLLNRALEFAPDFVRAQAALIDVVQMRGLREGRFGSFGQRHFPELDRLLEQVRGVLAIEPDLAEAYATLGTTLASQWNRAEAERAYRRATELNPNYATGRHWFGMHLAEDGRMDEALAELKLASELDPMSFIILDNYGWLLCLAGRYSEGLRMLDRALALNPGFDQTNRFKVSALAALGRVSEAAALARQTKSVERELDVVLLSAVGLHAEAETLLGSLDARTITNRFQTLLAVGRREEALAALDDLSGVSKGHCIEVSFLPFFDSVRDDPRFIKYLATLGLTQAHARAQAWRAAHPPEKSEAKP